MTTAKKGIVLVDMDGTLFDTVDVNVESYRMALEELGYPVDRELFVSQCYGKHYQDFLPILMGFTPDHELMERVHERKKALYEPCLQYARKNEALFALLHAMRQEYHIGLVTTASRKNTMEILRHFDCAELFELVLTQEDVVKNKPDPEGYLKAMAHFGAAPEQTMIFEDSKTGIAAAKATGASVFSCAQF